MNKRAILTLGILALILVSFSLVTAQKSALAPGRAAVPIPTEQIRPVMPPLAVGAKDYCFLDYTDWNPAYYWTHWKYGDKVAIYFDPEDCGNPENYPFQLTDVHFYLIDHAGVGACSLRFSVEVVCPDFCDGPGIEIWKSSTYNITTFYPDLIEIYFDDTVCLDKPFFFNVEFLQGPEGQVPSLLWDNQTVDPCYQWLWFGQPAWYEWNDYFGTGTPGWVCLGVSGYCGEEQTDCGWWYWKPDKPDQEFPAPSGMPDFDQNQDDWSCYCGPTAVANCLWWYNAVPPGMSPPDFIELLAGYFSTNVGITGTHVDSIQAGLERYFDDYGFALTETTYWMPDFYEMEDSLKKCQDIILLLGFWWYDEGTEQEFIRGDVNEDGVVNTADIADCISGPPFSCDDAADANDDGVLNTLDCDYLTDFLFSGGPPPPPPFPDCGLDPTPDALGCADFPPCPGGGGEWYREGGHFVTMAGVNSEKKEIAISDPDRDQCVRYPWWPGRVRTTVHLPWGAYDGTYHNDPQYVSHDVYVSLLFPEHPSPGSDVWDLADYCYGQTFPLMNVPHRFEAYSRAAPKHYEYFHTEVEAAVMICPKDTTRNHFKTWRVEPEPFTQIVIVKDQFTIGTLVLGTKEFFSNPCRKDTFEIIDEFEHLTWYRATGRDTLLEVEYVNQFGTYTNTIDSAKYLLVPTAKETYPFPESLDHYKAYRIADPVSFDRTVVLQDQFDIMFGDLEYIVTLKPTYFLTPAIKNFETPSMFDPSTHYVAYEIFPQHYYGLIQVQTDDQFGEHFLQVDSSKFLLVPTGKLRAEPPPNHPPVIGQPDFLEGYVDDIVSYEITGSDPDGDVILDEASIDIQPGCGSGYSITRTSGHGTSSGTWQVTWYTDGCTVCDTHMVIHDLTDEHGLTAYCTTYVHLGEWNDSLWYWKPDTTWAPSGMPDFDQNQPGWIAYCGPTAVANCLWWYGAVPTGWTPPQLIDTLARYFHTSPIWGTYVDTMQMGLEQYFQDYGFAFQESTFEMPDFFEMEDSLKRCQDIILLIGFWFYDEYSETWYREGGHYVTMAGVCSESLKIAISDPDADRAETGWPGRVRPPDHPPHPGDPLLHNDPQYVSHDMYQSILDSPFPSPGNPFWEIDYPWGMKPGRFAGFNVPQKFKDVTRRAPEGGKQIFATEVEYAVMICPEQEEPRECDEDDPNECDTLWVECGNMLVPPGGGLVTVDLTIFNDETLQAILVPISYEGSPECCDSLIESENTLAKVFAGSRVEDWGLNAININHQAKKVTLTAVPLTQPPLPPGKGHFATLRLFGDSCCTILLDTTFFDPNNSIQFVDYPALTTFYPVCRIDTCHIGRNYPPVIGQPDFLEGLVDDVVEYNITGSDPDGDAIEDDASIDIQPACGSWNIVRTSGHGTSSGTWTITWDTHGCTPCDTHMVIHDLTDVLGATSYCTTLVHLSEPESLYWKPPYEDYAPNGMPDIDQKQDGWRKLETEQWSFCGPCAVANCFKWFDSKYNQPPGVPGDAMDRFPLVRDYTDNLPSIWMPTPWDDHSPENIDHTGTPWGPAIGPPPPTPQPFMPGPQPPPVIPNPWGELVERLAWFFDTDGIQSEYCNHTGTNILQMQQGIQDWLESETFADGSTIADTLCMVLTSRPSFAYVESLVEKCEDVILLLGFWYEEPEGSGVWYRIGGHYVTVAGINSEHYRIAFSDPFIDAAEFGAPGRIGDGTIIPHSFPHDPTVHNDEGNVSHDIYTVDTASISPGGDWWLPDYAVRGDPGYWSWNFYEQNVPDEFLSVTAPWNGTSPIYAEVEYCIHISPWDYRGDVAPTGGNGVIDVGDAIYLLNYLFKGGPAPDPYMEGDTNCDGVVNLGDAITILNYLFKGWPIPKCCDP